MSFRPFATTVLTLAALAALAVPASLYSADPARVGVVNFREALLATAEMQKKADELEAKFRPRQQELAQLNQELEQLQERLANASGQEALSLQAEAQRKQRQAQRMQEDLQSDVEFERSTILQDAQEKMRAVVEQIANQKKLDLVVDVSNAIYFRPALEITQEVTAAYNKAHPVSQ